ncbi:glycosyltransferase family 4 protein [Rhizobium sp. 0TCS1.26]
MMQQGQPRKILMTLDAVGGVWRYAMDLAAGLSAQGSEVVFAGFGPQPSADKRCEAEAIGDLVWLDAPLDWMVSDPQDLAGIPDLLSDLVSRHGVDLVHLNLPTQAANLRVDVPVVAVSHSCVVTWFAGVRRQDVPDDWAWQKHLNAQGLRRADRVIAPSRAHADMLEACYGPMPHLTVVHNASRVAVLASSPNREPFALAAGRWWDDGKNGLVLDQAAASTNWPVVMAGPTTGPNGQSVTLANVDHRGELGHAATMDLMRRAAIFVSPSVYEPFGLAPLEAARLGAALILADIPTYRELWDGAALFAEASDPQAFADAINRLAERPVLRANLSRRARGISRRFTPEVQAEQTSRIYASLLSPSLVPAAAE